MKGKKYMYLKEIEVPLYRMYLVIILTNDIKKVPKMIKNNIDKYTYASTLLNGVKSYVVFNFGLRRSAMYLKTISHEAIHSTMDILRERGVEICSESEEALTYLNEWIFNEIIKFAKEKKLLREIKSYE